MDIVSSMIYFLKLTLEPEVLWIVTPLAIAVILMSSYAWVYKEEGAEWSSHLASSLVLVFVSIALFRYIHNLGGFGIQNFFTHLQKTLVTLFLLAMGLIFVRFNFEHVIPKKIADYLNSPLTVNLFAFVVILFVHSERGLTLENIISLLLIVGLLSVILLSLKFPMRFVSSYLEKEKKKERLCNIREAAYQIKELKRELRRRDKELKEIKLKQLEKGKTEAIQSKKILRKVLGKS